MKILNIRIDKEFEQKLRNKAEQKNIKFSRYLRSLIDKGFAIETQLETMGVDKSDTKNNEAFQIRLAEVLVEILIHARKLIEINPALKGKENEILLDAQNRSKSYINKISNNKDEL